MSTLKNNGQQLTAVYLDNIDFHSHILPGIDDGAEDIKKSLSLISAATKSGIEKIVATPHFYAHKISLESFLKRRQKAYNSVLDQKPQISIEMGAEVLVFPGLENLEGLDNLLINGEVLLLELPLSESIITDDYFDTIETLSKKYHLVLAHANRYSDYIVSQMLEIGAMLQINVKDISLRRERLRIKEWANMGYIYALGTDAHRKASVYKYFSRAKKYLMALDDKK